MFGQAIGSNRRLLVKICGITNAADAEAAMDAGADALGFNFFPGSKRSIDLRQDAEWIARLPGEICKVAVLVNPALSEATQIGGLAFIDALQLHGSESPGFCQLLADRGIRFAKALAVGNQQLFTEVPNFFTDTVLIDSFSKQGFGGTGRVLPWKVGRQFVEDHPALKVILAGGLNAENVAEAIHEVSPFAVDVTSGVESSPGRKDPNRLRAFIAAVRSS
jgi:phosphoribosylanthranilate isomerase